MRPGQPAEQLSQEGRVGNSNADGIPIGQANIKIINVQAAPGDAGVYLVDNYNRKIRLLRPDDTVTTVAGDGCKNYPNLGDNGPATAACWFTLEDVAVGPDGGLYTSDFSSRSLFSGSESPRRKVTK